VDITAQPRPARPANSKAEIFVVPNQESAALTRRFKDFCCRVFYIVTLIAGPGESNQHLGFWRWRRHQAPQPHDALQDFRRPISKRTMNAEINCLDSGGFGAMDYNHTRRFPPEGRNNDHKGKETLYLLKLPQVSSLSFCRMQSLS
jgi:hypothetical protein